MARNVLVIFNFFRNSTEIYFQNAKSEIKSFSGKENRHQTYRQDKNDNQTSHVMLFVIKVLSGNLAEKLLCFHRFQTICKEHFSYPEILPPYYSS